MLSQVSSQILRAVVTRQPAGLTSIGIRDAHAHAGAHGHAVDKPHPDPHSLTPNSFLKKHIADLDDMPQVGGSWHEYVDDRNSKWNKQLIASALLFIGVFVTVQQHTFWNAFPPELPEEMKNYHPWKDRQE